MAKNGNTSWIARCKAYMKQHGCQLGEAMKALSNKNKGRGKSFRGGNGVAANAEAFQGGLPATQPAPPTPPSTTSTLPPTSSALEKFGGLFEVGGAPQTQSAGRRKSHRKRGGKKSRCGSKRKSGSKRRRHRSRRGGSGGNSSSLSFSDYA